MWRGPYMLEAAEQALICRAEQDMCCSTQPVIQYNNSHSYTHSQRTEPYQSATEVALYLLDSTNEHTEAYMHCIFPDRTPRHYSQLILQ